MSSRVYEKQSGLHEENMEYVGINTQFCLLRRTIGLPQKINAHVDYVSVAAIACGGALPRGGLLLRPPIIQQYHWEEITSA